MLAGLRFPVRFRLYKTGPIAGTSPLPATRREPWTSEGERMPSLKLETREKLRTVSVATLCTALFKRGLRNQFVQDVRPLNPGAGTMVGEAFTLRYIPAREDLNPLSVFQDRAHPQRKAVEDCPPGAVMVIDSRKDPRAASAGGILVSRLMKRGVAGVVTDGGFRDSYEIAGLPFPTYHNRPSSPTNLTLHQAIDINVPIGCGDVAVFPGDVVVGDAEGVIVIPVHLADEVAAEAVEMTAFEDFVTEEVLKGRSILGLYPATEEQTKTDFAAWRKANGR
jgi:regulator of RNase E activity RraA